MINVKPVIIYHNLETVKRLTQTTRVQAKYKRSLDVLAFIAKTGITTKTGIMLGIGETEEEIFQTMDDSLEAGCKIFTMGQYLQPTKEHLPVIRYVNPDEFNKLKEIGLSKGFKFVESGPLVRSSYHAEKQVIK